MSGELPRGEGTRMRIGFEGKDCARTAVAVNAARTHARIRFIGRLSLARTARSRVCAFREGGHRSFASADQPLREQAGFLGHLLCDLRRDGRFINCLVSRTTRGGNAASAAAAARAALEQVSSGTISVTMPAARASAAVNACPRAATRRRAP